MTVYSTLGFSSTDLAAAVALAIIYEIKINRLALDEFPGIQIRHSRDGFLIQMTAGLLKQEYPLTDNEAIEAVRVMKTAGVHTDRVFMLTQEALVQIEAKA